ncbi:hypothetical protein G7046_g1233 [Stylonectria norvegica]|nr:hypothetical protein G7046_g1233 [Stylonectria norvegica]
MPNSSDNESENYVMSTEHDPALPPNDQGQGVWKQLTSTQEVDFTSLQQPELTSMQQPEPTPTQEMVLASQEMVLASMQQPELTSMQQVLESINSCEITVTETTTEIATHGNLRLWATTYNCSHVTIQPNDLQATEFLENLYKVHGTSRADLYDRKIFFYWTTSE